MSRAPDGAPRRLLGRALESDTDDCIDDWPYAIEHGYPVLFIEGSKRRANRWVCRLAHGEAPAEDSHAAHGCGNSRCLNPRHIRWATPAENHADKVAHGTIPRGESHPAARLTEADVRTIKAALAAGRSGAAIAREYGVSHSLVSQIKSGLKWRHVDVEVTAR